MDEMQERKKIVFLSSSFVNLAHLFAQNNPDFDIFLILDRKFPVDFDEEMDNFYTYTFDKNKTFEKDKEKYFDMLGVFIDGFEPDFIITNNFTKILPQSFLDFMKFRNAQINILNIHHGDLRIIENSEMKYKGLDQDVKQFLDMEEFSSTIHIIENSRPDEGKQLFQSHPTTLKELKQKGFLHKKEEIINYRLRNVVLSYHARTKVLKHLRKIFDDLEE
ncbi:MAG: hypothetical protein PF569_07630 [Candidatus Woesearchaeota archaeon]|jgi:folate-dependent phosphoribosylglycinamide formyltransferase PurN|nr:hypothetical protein [Candidatus Woesearchaeota archaeon]